MRTYIGTHAIAIGLTAITLLTGCSTMQVTSEHKSGSDFAGLKTFDFTTGNLLKAADPKVDVASVRLQLRDAIVSELTAKGYRRVTGGTPNFVIGYQGIGVNKEEELEQDPFTIGSSTLWEDLPRTPYVKSSREGTLVLTVGDPATKQIIWRGAAVSQINQSITPAERQKLLRNAVQKILQSFPPR